MKKVVLLFFLIVTSLHFANAQSDSTIKANQILKIEQLLEDALPGDSSTWSKYLDKNWYITTEDGTGLFRKEFLAGFSSFPKGFSGNIKVTKPVFSFHGDIAVVHYAADEHETVFGQELHTSYGTENTWYKTPKGWMMLSSLTFEIPQLPPAIKVETSVLTKYTGTYQLTEGSMVVISLKNDTLYYQKNTRKPEALFAETENIFFRKSDTRGRKLFVKNDSGQMVLLERRNGQDLVWKKKSS
jgi:hypothetical protein